MAAIIELTIQQKEAVFQAVDWMKQGVSVVSLAGPAGSGKTTAIKALVIELKKIGFDVQVCATTQKATRVLNSKGIEALTVHQVCLTPLFQPPFDRLADYLGKAQDIEDNNKISVPPSVANAYGSEDLHAALDAFRRAGIYSAFRYLGVKDPLKFIEAWLPCGPKPGVVIIDEASMMGDEDLEKVMKVYDLVILVGDEFQLPPVKAKPVFWEVKHRVALTEIHRQAAGSQPLMLATRVRNGEVVTLGPKVEIDLDLSRRGMPVICWKNTTRIATALQIRAGLGYRALPPQPGEVLVCRGGGDKAAKEKGLITNSLWTVIDADGFKCDLEGENGEIVKNEHVFIEELNRGDGMPFRLAYAMTCHTSQGSSFNKVMIHVADAMEYNRKRKEESRKWLYTAITRAEKEVLWV